MNRPPDEYAARRRKEDLSFLVVRFLKAYVLFEGVYRDFREHIGTHSSFEYAGLFARIKALEEKIMFDVKERAHYLFRSGPAGSGAAKAARAAGYGELERVFLLDHGEIADKGQAREIFSELRHSLVAKSLDAYIGTGFHMFMILRESFYQLEFYVPQYLCEMEYLERIEYLMQRIGYTLNEEEEHELQHIKQIVRLSQSIASETRELASIATERCRSLFRESAQIIRHSVEESGDNEVLVLNLLREEPLLEQVYGAGAAEAIFAHMFRHLDAPGKSGRDKAREFALERCGNTASLG